jgi:hypothetical protein
MFLLTDGGKGGERKRERERERERSNAVDRFD